MRIIKKDDFEDEWNPKWDVQEKLQYNDRSIDTGKYLGYNWKGEMERKEYVWREMRVQSN